MTGLQEYIRTLNIQDHSEWNAVSAYVTSVRVRSNGRVEWSVLVEALMPVDRLVDLEILLENHFSIREAMVTQQISETGGPEEQVRDASSYLPWLTRHVRNDDPYLSAMLSGSPCEVVKKGVCIRLPGGCAKQIDPKILGLLETLLFEGTGIRTTFSITESERRHLSQMAVEQNEIPAPEVLPYRVPDGKQESAGKNDTENPGMENAQYRYRKKLLKQEEGLLYGRFDRKMDVQPIGDLHVQSDVACFDGWIVEVAETRLVSKNTKVLVRFSVYDKTGTISCHAFMKPEVYEDKNASFSMGVYARFQARVGYDGKYSNDLDADLLGMASAEEPPKREDTAAVKRIELHCHTKMSMRDAVSDVSDVVATAVRWGHPAVAITDHGGVQAFPDARQALVESGSSDTKLIYGVECYLVDDGPTAAFGLDLDRTDRGFEPVGDDRLSGGYVALDVETTGLDPSVDRLIEVAAVLFEPGTDGHFVPAARFASFIAPGIPIPDKIVKLTGITDEMVRDAPDARTVLASLTAFIGERPVCAHNAFFDLSFLRYEGFRTAEPNGPRGKCNPVVVDTLRLSRHFSPKERNHRLNQVAERFSISLDNHHRAEDDARTSGLILDHILHSLDIRTLTGLNEWMGNTGYGHLRTARTKVYHCVLLARDNIGLYNLYRLVSLSHLRYFYNRSPRIPRSLLEYFRAGLIVGAACEAGEVFQHVSAAYKKADRSYDACEAIMRTWEFRKMARFYDYLEIQPLTNNRFMTRDKTGVAVDASDLQALNRLVVALGDAADRPVCATCDAHFVEKSDGVLRKILTAEMFSDYDLQADLYFRTTGEMLEEFAYLGETRAREVVLDQPRKIADRIDGNLVPFPDGFYPPVIPDAAHDVEKLTRDTAAAMYGKDGKLPEIVEERIARELQSIIGNGFATMYDIARRLVRQSNLDGYLVGSRGSVGSSFVATLCGITEVNPMAPHYLCSSCKHSEFDDSGRYGSGYDMPDRNCPECGTPMDKEGQDIPFETFLGFDGDKLPDIDLNFSGEYQGKAHRLIEELFGKAYTYKAGTISTYAEKNAMAMVYNYFEKTGAYATEAEKRRLANRVRGVRQTTGQHPGATVVVPKDREIYDFTPVQNPADKDANGIITTHFDFNSLHDTILKLDILGKDDPTMMRFLQDVTGVDVLTVPFMDDKIMSLFTSTEALGIPKGSWDVDVGTLSLPEMGTFMARGMIRDIRPVRFYDLVQLMGLSHGTNVWVGNAQDLIRKGVCDITRVIGCRDSIMTTLIHLGLPSKMSFDIMEGVRKGRGLTDEQEAEMLDREVPDWYIESCKKISYMFPKAHAVAYAISALRLAWFKVYRAAHYYCSFFTVRADEFDCMEMCGSKTDVRARRKSLLQRMRGEGERLTALEERKYYILELIEEMHLRNIEFLPVDIYLSDADQYLVEQEDRIRPPLNAVPGVSAVTAGRIVEARKKGVFKSHEDLATKAGVNSAIISSLREAGCLDALPESSQLDLFSLA